MFRRQTGVGHVFVLLSLPGGSPCPLLNRALVFSFFSSSTLLFEHALVLQQSSLSLDLHSTQGKLPPSFPCVLRSN